MKIKKLVLLSLLSIVVFSCKKDDTLEPFDAAAQSIIDDSALIEYLQSHYLNDEDGAIWTIKNGETPLMDNVDVKTVENNDIEYKLYFMILNEGVGEQPSKFDSVVVNLSGIKLDSTIFQRQSNNARFDLADILYRGGASGFSYGTEELKSGEMIINSDESFDFENSGEGIFFLPSGLGYANIGSQGAGVEPNSPLIFKITLNSFNAADHDNDWVSSKDEDVDNDGDLLNDDTDEDGNANFMDDDDDGDGILTKDEDANGDGNLFNDDTDGDGIPNFLDKDN